MSYWHIGPRLRDDTHLVHTSFGSVSSDADEFFVPCKGHWVRTEKRFNEHQRTESMVTCIVCTMFVVHRGEISLWVPR